MIDFRSDTFTKPNDHMLQAMMAASVGDDVFGEDPTVNELEKYAASLFGKEAGLFCPSGTMTNQIAIRVHTQIGDEVICEKNAHVYKYEGGGIASNSLCSVKLLEGERGILHPDQLPGAFNNPKDPHFPLSRLVCLENTSNFGGGSIYPKENLIGFREKTLEMNLSLHLDGARVFNALEEANYTSQEMGEWFDSISICLSKGLGAPVGSVLVGDQGFIDKARRVRKSLGGGMRQAGYLAAAGLYALVHNRSRLKEDHAAMREIAEVLKPLDWIEQVEYPETNILFFTTKGPAQNLVDELAKHHIQALAVAKNRIRMVGHLDIAPYDYQVTKSLLPKLEISF